MKVIKGAHLQPGDCISIDQYISSHKGRYRLDMGKLRRIRRMEVEPFLLIMRVASFMINIMSPCLRGYDMF